jgi:hypothetical protein
VIVDGGATFDKRRRKYAVLICPHRNEGEFEAKLDELDGLLELCRVRDLSDRSEVVLA